MGINATVTRREDGGWSFTWVPGTPPYVIWLNGTLVVEGLEDESYEYVLAGFDSFPPPLEILNAGAMSEGEAHPPYQYLQWRGVPDANGYVIQQLIESNWTTVASRQETKKGYYNWQSPIVDDNVTVMYRVIAVDLSGNQGDPLEFLMTLACNPQPPTVDIDIVSGDVVVSAG